MAKAWKIKGLEPGAPVERAAHQILAVRVAEFYSYAPFIHDPSRVQELHDMRIAAKRLRYTLEIFRPILSSDVEYLLDQVRAVQELLGEVHDADVLAPFLERRLLELDQAAEQDLVVKLDLETDEARRLDAIRAHLQPPEPDPRIGIYALLGRTRHRRRQRYAAFLDLWAQLETRCFRAELEALARRAAAAEDVPQGSTGQTAPAAAAQP